MKLRDFLTLKSGSGILLSGNVYNPYINYSWSQTLTVGGNQQIKDIGTAGLNLQQFFGQGVWFNGIDQNITIETVDSAGPSPIWTICFNVNTASTNKYIIRTIGGALKVLWFNGGLTYYNGSENIKLDTTNSNRAGSYVVKSDGSNIYTYLNNILISTIPQTVERLSFGLIKDLAGYSNGSAYLGVLKDVFLFKKSLSKTEIEKYNNQPNQFFIDSLEDVSCVLAMPMCEKDGFVRNYKSYSEGSNLVVDGSFGNQSLWVIGDSTKISISGNAVNFNNSSSFVYPTPSLAIFNTPTTINKCFMVELEVFNYQSGSVRVEIGASVANNNSTPFLTSNGKYQLIVKHTTNSSYRPIFRAINFIGSITNLRVKELTSIYPITNYLETCRTNAQRLPYGLQTSGFKRDNNGLILGKSNSLECDGVGYGNTGWIPENGQEFTIEWIYANPRNGVDVVLEGMGIEINNNADLYLRQIRTTGTINVKFGANSIDISSVTFKMIYLAVTVTSGNFTVYVNSINRSTSSNTYNRTLNALNRTFFLGGVNRGSIEKIMTKESKLFKVHQKALSQEEVTKNFNKYQAQGLLNE